MPKKLRKKKTVQESFIHAVIAASLGMGLTLLLLCLSAALILGGHVREERVDLCILLSVFLGCTLAAAVWRQKQPGIIPGILITTVSFMALVILLSALGEKESMLGPLFIPTLLAALAGSITGMVTNLVKSNKSYIIKSNRKRSIT